MDGLQFFQDGFVDFLIAGLAGGFQCDFKGEMNFPFVFNHKEIVVIQWKAGAVDGRLQVSSVLLLSRIRHRFRVRVHHGLHLQFFTENGHYIFGNLMAPHQAEGTVQFYVRRGEMILRAVVVDDEIVNAVDAGAGEDAFFDFLIKAGFRRGAKDRIQRAPHNAIAGPQNEECHNDAHDAIDLQVKEIFNQGGRQYTGGGEHV